MKYVFAAIMLANVLLGHKFLINTQHKKYLVRTKVNKSSKDPEPGSDYSADYQGGQ